MNIMKRISSVIVVLNALLMVTPVDAQQRIGFVGGLNISNANFVDLSEANISGRNVFGIGAVLDLGLNQNFVLRLEPMYSICSAPFCKYIGSRRRTIFLPRLRSKTAPNPKRVRLEESTSSPLNLAKFTPRTKPIRC